ncbi:fructokinase [Ferrimonas balearica]|uniref:fructokinase n=1 Tax=Ferrimonas balearica TaxID=44012 RepID=UPI001C996CF3|nr:fructokinase [Ferrimonas balearica]MBY5921217.1 fructokinase [Ferrimonas balearica]MBY5996098.1 fructokinase [Ferrimonas balearica]
MTGTPLPPLRLGVDLGGTKIELIALNPQGQVRWQQRIPTPSGSYRATIEAIAGLVQRCESELGESGTVGVGIPGVVSRQTQRVKGANSVCLNGQPLEQDLGALLGRPIRTANDANCFAISEATDGAAVGYRTVFGIILGTGCGAGIAVDGRVHEGPNGIAGEWGHNPLPWMTEAEFPGPDCFCGRRGCIETFISGTNLARQYREHTGLTLAGAQILERVDAGEASAEQVFEAFLSQLTRALAHVINLLDPDCIVLGGGLSNVERLYELLPKRLPGYTVGGECATPILKHHHGDASGVRGAAWLWGR